MRAGALSIGMPLTFNLSNPFSNRLGFYRLNITREIVGDTTECYRLMKDIIDIPFRPKPLGKFTAMVSLLADFMIVN